MGHKARIALILAGLGTVTLFFLSIAYHQLYQRGLEAEAKLMISYAHTLEKVYHLENKSYAYWSSPYGATLEGVDHCEQPDEAAAIGFSVAGCHREGAPIPRYAFHIQKLEGSDQYLIEATGGSDGQGRSLVCFQSRGREVWQSSQNLEFKQIISCW